MFLDELPRDLVLIIFGSGFLEVPDIVSLDTALCSAQLRGWVHQVYDGLRSCSFDDWEYNSITALRWVMDRQIDLQNFKVRLRVRGNTTWKYFSHMDSFHMVIFMGLVDVARLMVTKTPVAVNSSTMIGVHSIMKLCDLLIPQMGGFRNGMQKTAQSSDTSNFDDDDESWQSESSDESFDLFDSDSSWSYLTGRDVRCNALKLACLRGDETMVHMLLTDGAADPNHGTEETNFELRPLSYACVTGGNPTDLLRVLLDAGASPSTSELTMAVKHCEFLCCVESSSQKKVVNFDDSSLPSRSDDFDDATRALHRTFARKFLRCDLSEAWRNQLAAVRLLGSHVRVDECGSGTEFNPWDPPLQCASGMGLHEVVSILLEHCGADPNSCRSEDVENLRPEIYPPLEVAMTCPRYETYSHRVDWCKTIKELIDHGARVDKLATAGYLYVHSICSRCHSWGWDDTSLAILRLLYDYGGADVNLIDASGATLLYLLCFWIAESANADSIGVVSMLLDFSADANLANPKRRNQTALHASLVRTEGLPFDFACTAKLVDILLTKGDADPTRADADGNTPLHYIAQNCAELREQCAETEESIYSIIETLLSHGAQTGIENKAGLAPAGLYQMLVTENESMYASGTRLLSPGILSALNGT